MVLKKVTLTFFVKTKILDENKDEGGVKINIK